MRGGREREGGRGERERGREGGREGRREGGREGGREGDREGGREGGREAEGGRGREWSLHNRGALIYQQASLAHIRG